jgi:hypothetical protein
MKLAAIETIHTLYPEQDWLHIDMNGSVPGRAVNPGTGIHCKLFSFWLQLGQHATHFDGEIEAVNDAALRKLFGTMGSLKKAIIFSDSAAAILSVAKYGALPSKRITEIHSSIKLLKGLQKRYKIPVDVIPLWCCG